MAGVDDFDPMADLSERDLAHLRQEHRDAATRQRAAWQDRGLSLSEEDKLLREEDRLRRERSNAFRMKTMQDAGMTPAQIAKAMEGAPPPESDEAAVATATSGSPHVATSAPGLFSVLLACDQESDPSTAFRGEYFAPDWDSLKDIIKDHDGAWNVERHEFHSHVALILGFFEKPGWEKPEDSLKESFEVIVRNGRVFRTDPE